MERRHLHWPFSRDTVEKISAMKGEPAWMTERRLTAWDRFDTLSRLMPAFTGVDLEALEAFLEPPKLAVPQQQWPRDLEHTLSERGDEEGLIVQRDSTILSRSVTKDSIKRGVLFMDLDSAVKTAPDLVKRYFATGMGTEDRWSALHTALWSGGCFLYVPEFVELHLPFHFCSWLSAPGTAIFPYLLMVVERGSQVYFLDEHLSAAWEQPNLAVGVSEFHIAERAQVHYFHLQNWGPQVTQVRREASQIASTGNLFQWSATMGGTDNVSLTLESGAGGQHQTETAVAGPLDPRLCGQLEREGMSRSEAEYAAASRFFDPLLDRLPNDPLREKIRHYLVGQVTGHRRTVTLHRASQLHPEIRP